MDAQHKGLIDLVGPDGLQRKLESLLGQQQSGIAVAVYQQGETHTATLNGFTPRSTVQTGCVTKAVTATLIAIAQSEGRLRLDDSVSALVGEDAIPAALSEHLHTTRLYHLLNHTSGLDHSMLSHSLREADGMFDAASLLHDLASAGVLSPSGTVFGYSSVGPWLAGAMLERAYGKPYRAVLDHLLLKPLGIEALADDRAADVCPSFGGDLRLSADDLMKIALLQLHGDQAQPEIEAHVKMLHTKYPVELPELPLSGVRAYPGWFDFGNSLGHSGHGDESSGAIRFLPEQDAAIVIAAAHPMLAKTALAVLFKDVLDEYRNLSLMKLLTQEQWSTTDPRPYQGTFENAKYRLRVDTATNGSLRAQVFRKHDEQDGDDAEPYIKRYLKPATNDTFIPAQPESQVCPVLIYSHPGPDGAFCHVSTNLYLFRRTA